VYCRCKIPKTSLFHSYHLPGRCCSAQSLERQTLSQTNPGLNPAFSKRGNVRSLYVAFVHTAARMNIIAIESCVCLCTSKASRINCNAFECFSVKLGWCPIEWNVKSPKVWILLYINTITFHTAIFHRQCKSRYT